VWLPQWLEERPEVSDKAKKLYAYLTYFAGGKGYAWPSFNHLAVKLHVSRRYVIKLVQELSAHCLIAATNVAAFTSDAKARWASEWLGWPGYGKFWGQIARMLVRPPKRSRRKYP
jgi:hypothetical protein